MNNKFAGKLNAILFAILCCLLWGSAFPVVKLNFQVLNLSNTFDVIQLAGLRFFLGGVLLLLFLAFFLKIPLKPTKKEWKTILILSVMQTFAAYAINYVGFSNSEASKASILSSSELFWMVILSHIFFNDDKINVRKILGLLFGVLGIIAVNVMDGKRLSLSFNVTGEGFLLISYFLISLGMIIAKKQSDGINMYRVNGFQMLFGGFMMVALGLIGKPQLIRFNWLGGGLLFYLALLSSIAFSIWFMLLKFHKATEISIFKFIMPIFGTILSVFILPGEKLTWATVLGLVLVAAGITITNLPDKDKTLKITQNGKTDI